MRLRDTPSSHEVKVADETVISEIQVCPRVYITDNRELRYRPCWKHGDGLAINLSEIEKWLAQDRNPRDLLAPDQQLLVLGTEENDVVAQRTIPAVLKSLKAVAPVTYIPDCGTVYGADPDSITDGGIEAYIEHLHKLVESVAALPQTIRLLPLDPGVCVEHHERMATVIDDHEFRAIALYVVEFVGKNNGNDVSGMLEYVRSAVSIIDPDAALVIGRGNPADIARFPPKACAVCAHRQWIRRARTGGQERVRRWVNDVSRALSSRATQTRIDRY